mmetsp:Transcript_33175/g.66004  ORF Transcript_33175/g.66004 Transcript_33175/m.66004 type:complete len:247 (-) Transcript_33175:1321-2061(-)
MLQFMRNFALGVFWQTPPPIIPDDIAKVQAKARLSSLSGWEYAPPKPGENMDIPEHLLMIETEISNRVNAIQVEIEALAATVQQAAIKEKEIRITRRRDAEEHDILLDHHQSLLSNAWSVLASCSGLLEPYDGKKDEEEGWKAFAPVKGSVSRVRNSTRWLFVWVVIFHAFPLLMRWHWDRAFHAEHFGMSAHSLTGMIEVPHIDDYFIEHLSDSKADALEATLKVEEWGVLVLLGIFLIMLCKLM